MKIGIIAAMPQELKILVESLQNGEKHLRLGKVYYTGSIGRHEVVLVESGIGKVMSAMSVAVLANDFKVEAIINTGSAGALASGIAVGNIVLADKLAYHDVDVTAFGYKYGQMAGQPITTGDSFIASEEKVAAIREHFPEVLAVEMEGAAIAQAAHAAGRPFMVIRAMSDTADHAANISFDEFIGEAGERSARTLITFLKRLV